MNGFELKIIASNFIETKLLISEAISGMDLLQHTIGNNLTSAVPASGDHFRISFKFKRNTDKSSTVHYLCRIIGGLSSKSHDAGDEREVKVGLNERLLPVLA